MIIGIVGGIGTGKTLSLSALGLQDIYAKKKVFSNVKFKNLGKYDKYVEYLTKDKIKDLFNLIKNKSLDVRNSTLLLQEAHNYIDSRNSSSMQNKTITYFILQSRHFGTDIVFDTQNIGQVDIRLRKNMDMLINPYITQTIDDVPSKVMLVGRTKLLHKWTTFSMDLDVKDAIKKYDTHEIVDF